jgi:predicted peptidase
MGNLSGTDGVFARSRVKSYNGSTTAAALKAEKENRGMATPAADKPQLLRKPYTSTATGHQREYFLYLPRGYGAETERVWPVILFLHGGGERGNGLADLDYVLVHGPLMEAWIQRRDLPFIIVAPQLPVFGMHDQVGLREERPRPKRLASGVPPRRVEARMDQPMQRSPDDTPAPFGVTDEWGKKGAVKGWQRCEEDLLSIVDATLRDYRANPKRVYLTGLSYGGYGTWHMATAHPERWAAIAPICGGGNPELAHRLVQVEMPIWIFQGGRDPLVKPQWIYAMANALEQAGHKTVRLTVHEDLGHDAWTRVYAGEDLYNWLLSHQIK